MDRNHLVAVFDNSLCLWRHGWTGRGVFGVALSLGLAACAGGSSTTDAENAFGSNGDNQGGSSGQGTSGTGGDSTAGSGGVGASGNNGGSGGTGGFAGSHTGGSGGSGGNGAGGSGVDTDGGTSGSGGGDTDGGTGGTGGSGGSGGGGSTFPPASDFGATGTFMTTSKDEGPMCTIFRPATLGEGGLVHPAIVWGNGTFNTPSNYTNLFNHFASHGFIVAAADTSNAGSGKEMLDCLGYLLDQNKASGSVYEGKVDVAHIAASGYSQGGAGTLEAGIDPRFAVTAPVSPFIVLSLGGYDTASVGKQVHPMFLISGSSDTVATPDTNQTPIFMQAKVPIVWGTHTGSTHFEVLDTGGAYKAPLTAWFRYKLMNDSAAADWFKTSPCTLCSTTGWMVQHNSMWMD